MIELKKKIPVASPYFGGNEKKFAYDAINSGEISGNFGKYISKFETDFASFCDADYAISTTNGTTALHVALASLDITAGDEVLVQTLTNMASVFSICYTGATPIPVDVTYDTCNIDSDLIESKITHKTKAIVVVHLFGHPVDMDPIMAIAKKHNIYVLEDCAEAHGALYKDRKVGSIGDIGCFSFYANKLMTTGEGGMVVTNNLNIANRVQNLHSLSYGSGKDKFLHDEIGYNYRMSNIIAAVGCAQMQCIDQVIDMKRQIAFSYSNNLKLVGNLQLPVELPYAKNVYWMYHVILTGSAKGFREEIMKELSSFGIETRESFTPFNMQSIFIKKGIVKEEDCPVANNIGENGFYLPSGPVLSNDEIEYISSSLIDIMSSY
jgi:perosamine synthetase